MNTCGHTHRNGPLWSLKMCENILLANPPHLERKDCFSLKSRHDIFPEGGKGFIAGCYIKVKGEFHIFSFEIP